MAEPSGSRRCAVLGAGSWGTALATRLARNGSRVWLWDRDAELLEAIAARHENPRYLPGLRLPGGIFVRPRIEQAVENVGLVVIAVPTVGFRAVVGHLSRCTLAPDVQVVWATKGIETESGHWLHEVYETYFPQGPAGGVLSGPSFAGEVARGLPTAVTVAAGDLETASRIASWFHAEVFRTYVSDDVMGVELGGAVKNVLAIAAGISDGLGFGANARAALITRGLHEIMRLGEVLGARRETLMGLAGLGDLVLTCTDDQSRNRRFGLALGRGVDAARAAAEIGQAIEGRETARVLMRVVERAGGVDMPIAQHVYRILFQGLDPRDAVTALLSRSLKAEG